MTDKLSQKIMGMRGNLNDIRVIAKMFSWKEIEFQENIGMVSFWKILNNDHARINVYITKMTVATVINHPTKGKNQLFRKYVSGDQLREIFKNPRVHTDKGYYTKRPISNANANK